jgi:hypothetical protein
MLIDRYLSKTHPAKPIWIKHGAKPAKIIPKHIRRELGRLTLSHTCDFAWYTCAISEDIIRDVGNRRYYIGPGEVVIYIS